MTQSDKPSLYGNKHTLLDELSIAFPLPRIPQKSQDVHTILQEAEMRRENPPSFNPESVHEPHKNVDSFSGKRKSAESGDSGSTSPNEKIVKTKQKRIHSEYTQCPYCSEKLNLSKANGERHLIVCYEKQQRKIRVEQDAKKSGRVSSRSDRYSPETYSNRAYNYFRGRK